LSRESEIRDPLKGAGAVTGISRLEDIEAWKKARILVKHIYQIAPAEPFTRDFTLRDPIRRAGISIISNSAEGVHRQTDQESARFSTSRDGPPAEVQSQLNVALDTDLLVGRPIRGGLRGLR
jgi:four helix bundle protein